MLHAGFRGGPKEVWMQSVLTENSEEVAIGPAAGEFVALSRFTIANGMEAEVWQAFRGRPHQVDGAAGFVRMEVLAPVDTPAEVWLFTWWTDEASYRTWHHSHSYRDAHRGIPRGLKLVPGSASVRCFAHVSS
jgi:heme-degrading monooxygenase HmoA